MDINDITEYLKKNKVHRTIILSELLADEVITITELVSLRERILLEKLQSQKEEIANGYALVLRYKEKINKNTLDTDAQVYLENSSYTGLGKYHK